MAKHISCSDVTGSGCSFTAQAETEPELMEKVKAHAGTDHGVKDMTPELAARVKAAIRTR